MKSKSFFAFDLIIFFSIVALVTIGIIFIYSSGISSDGILQNNEYIKQIVWGVIGIIFYMLVSFFDYEKLRSYSNQIYYAMIIMLVIVLAFGSIVNGARSWISFKGVGFQPSEFMKIALIIQLAAFYEKNEKKYNDLVKFLIGMLLMAIPMGLVLIQPDMGTALVYLPIFLVISFTAGIKRRYIFFILLTGIFIIIFTLIPAWDSYIVIEKNLKITRILTEKHILLIVIGSIALIAGLCGAGLLFYKKAYFYWIGYFALILSIALGMTFIASDFLKDYQLKRLIIFLDPQVDPKGAGWNVIQSITAVGSGGPFGKGFLQGTQSHYRYLPQQSTDFIFSIIAEEWGFLGSIIVFVLFLVIMLRTLFVMTSVKDAFALYIGVGVVGMLFFHFIVNIGMAMGIMPVTGIPLLMVSYGGSSILTSMMALGLISSIYLHKYKY